MFWIDTFRQEEASVTNSKVINIEFLYYQMHCTHLHEAFTKPLKLRLYSSKAIEVI